MTHNPRNALAVFIVVIAFWLMMAGAAWHGVTHHWTPTPEACQSSQLTAGQEYACESAADSAYDSTLAR